jgi:DNA-directed RNA polymerase specialized sigma24 family protein
VEEQERLAAMRRHLARLGATDQEILRLTIVEDLKPGQIAATMGLSSEVVRARKSRALRRLIVRTRRSDA